MHSFSSPFEDSVSFAAASPGVAYALHPREEEILSPAASPKRRSEFLLGRAAAHRALKELLGDAPPVLKGQNREPIWPEGVCGSITHSGNWGLAAVAPATTALGLGIDLEFLSDETQNRSSIVKRICHREESKWVESEKDGRELRATMLFSAKESVFKALFPLVRRYIGFRDVIMHWDEENSDFQCRLLFDARDYLRSGSELQVKCVKGQGFVLSSLLLPSGDSLNAAA